MPRTIRDSLEWHAIHTPKKIAVVDTNTILTYEQFWDRVCRLANAMLGLGLGPGDRIAILMTNSARYLEVYHAIVAVGAAAVSLNFRFVASEIEYIVNHSQSKALFFDAAFEPVVRELEARLPSIGSNYIVTDAAPGAKSSGKVYEHLISIASPERPKIIVDPESCFFQGYTAGTTGFPKGCVNLHRGFVDFFKRVALLWGITPNDIELVPAPLFHEAPTLFAMLQIFRGGTVVVTRNTQPADILKLIGNHKITWSFMVPTMWDSLVSSDAIREASVGSMRVLVSAGSSLLTHTKDALIDFFPNAGLNEFYGGTEVGVVTNLGPEDQRRKIRSVGKPIPGFHVRLLAEDGHDVSSGEVGEIYMKGPILIREYFSNPEATASARKDEWFTLGDMGRFDEEGYLYIVDRKKDMIISGGENVYPAEVENVLYKHPAVAMVAVVGIPDPKWGESIYAAVVLKSGFQVSAEDFIAHCAGQLSRFKIPKKIEFVDKLPTSSFGKILRREVRRPFWEGRDANV